MEAFVGVLPVLFAAIAVANARRVHLVRFGPKLSWLLQVFTLPVQVLRDTGILIAALWRKLLGSKEPLATFSVTPFQAGGDDPRSAARRALAVSLTAVPPNSYVLSIDDEQNLALYNELVPQPQVPDTLKSLSKEEA
jgi:hypothetical protein